MSKPERDLFELLRCPTTHQRLLPVTRKWIDRLNARIRAGELSDESGRVVTEVIDDGLVSQDDQFLYPVRAGIANMFIADRIILKT